MDLWACSQVCMFGCCVLQCVCPWFCEYVGCVASFMFVCLWCLMFVGCVCVSAGLCAGVFAYLWICGLKCIQAYLSLFKCMSVNVNIF